MKFVSIRPNLANIDYICYEQDLGINENMIHQSFSSSSSSSSPQEINSEAFNQCGEVSI